MNIIKTAKKYWKHIPPGEFMIYLFVSIFVSFPAMTLGNGVLNSIHNATREEYVFMRGDYLIYAALCLSFAVIVNVIYAFFASSRHYAEMELRKGLSPIGAFLSWIVPCELLRMIICILFPYVGMYVASGPFYLRYALTEVGGIVGALAMLVSYVICSIPYCGLAMLVYVFRWKKCVGNNGFAIDFMNNKHNINDAKYAKMTVDEIREELNAKKARLKADSKEENNIRIKSIASSAMYFSAIGVLFGTFSNVIIMVVANIMTYFLLYDKKGIAIELSDLEVQLLWLLWALISLAVCVAGAYVFGGKIGGGAARFTSARSKDKNIFALDVKYMLSSCFIGNLFYGVIVAVFTLWNISGMFFAGPVQYIARFIAQADRALYVEDQFDFSDGIKLAAVVIYIVSLIISGLIGYIIGHKKECDAIKYEDRR